MAIARKIDPAALARAFADEISAFPEIKRVWYQARPNWIDPDRTTLHLTIQLERESKSADKAIADALTRLQAEYFEEFNVGSLQFILSENDVLTLDDLVGPDFTELPLREA